MTDGGRVPALEVEELQGLHAGAGQVLCHRRRNQQEGRSATGVKVKAYIHSLKDQEHDRHVLGDAEIVKSIGNNRFLAEVNGVKCTAIFNFFTGKYYVDDVNGIIDS